MATKKELDYAIQQFNNAQSLSEKQEYAGLFLDTKYDRWDKDLQAVKNILIKLCVELDSVESYNTFLTFVDKYIEFNGIFPDLNCLETINNLYASGIVDDHDLDDTSKEKGTQSHSIIFDPNLYLQDDPEFITKSYYWLSQPNNIKRINYNALAQDDRLIKNHLDDIIILAYNTLTYGDPGQEVRDTIIYDVPIGDVYDKKSLSGAKVRSANTIRDILHIASSRYATNNSSDKVADLFTRISGLSDAEKEDFLTRLSELGM